MDSDEVLIDYTNYKGRRSIRRIKPQSIHFAEGNPYHPEPQRLLVATDLEDGLLKTWSMHNIHRWTMGEHEDRRLKEMQQTRREEIKQLKTSGSVAALNAYLKTPVRRYIITGVSGEPYLERIFLKDYPDGSKDMLHIIYRSDDDRDMHDHPFNFESRIIRGRYINHMKTGSVTYGEGQTNIMRAEDAHRLEVLDGPVVTLVHRGPKIRDWGFHTIDGWVHHRDYLDKKFGKGNWVTGD
jgi:hypothetical protein